MALGVFLETSMKLITHFPKNYNFRIGIFFLPLEYLQIKSVFETRGR